MEKIKINNQIISMRKYVKQAKVRMINKRVKISKSLQTKHGDELQQQKYKRKTEKLLSEIEMMKKLNVDDISKAALMKDKNWQEVLSNKTATVEERAFALLANYNAVQTEVELFHRENTALAQLLPDLMKHWEEKKVFQPGKNSRTRKASELRLRKKEKMKKHQLQVRKKNNAVPISKSSTDPGDVDSDSCVHSGESVQDKCALDVADEDQKTFSESGEGSDHEMSEGKLFVKTGSIKLIGDKHSNDRVVSLDNILSKTPRSKIKTQKEIACVKLGDLKGKDTISIESDRDSSEEDDVDSNEKTNNHLKEDPFFIFGDEPIVEEPGKDSDSDSLPKRKISFRPDKLRGDRFLKGNSKPNGTERKNEHQFSKTASRGNFRNKMHGQKRVVEGRRFQRKEFRGNSRGGKFGQRRIMPTDRGTTFSKDAYEPKNLNVKRKMLPSKSTSNSSRESGRINPKTGSGNSASAALHPSWEAKKKLKQKEIGIAPFQGTKIKFDD